MTVLTAQSRKQMKGKTFGLPRQRKYPMPDKQHAENAKARAKQQLNKGNITKAQYQRIVAKANRVEKNHG